MARAPQTLTSALVSAGGVLLFLAAFPVAWRNESVPDLAGRCARAMPISDGRVHATAEGEAVALSGALQAGALLGDAPHLRPGPYLVLVRHVEAWGPDLEVPEHPNGRSAEGIPRTLGWHPVTLHARGAEGEPRDGGVVASRSAIGPARLFAPGAHVGAYSLRLVDAALPPLVPLRLRAEQVVPGAAARVEDGAIYVGPGTLADPAPGMLRVRYEAILDGTEVTVFGEAHGAEVIAHVYDEDSRLLRVALGDRAMALATLARQVPVHRWPLRLAAWLSMALGLAVLLGPLSRRSLLAALVPAVPIALLLLTLVALAARLLARPGIALGLVSVLGLLLAAAGRRRARPRAPQGLASSIVPAGSPPPV